LLLRGDDLVAARGWLAKRLQEAPEITEAQTAFLNASRAESQVARRQRLLAQAAFGALAAVVVVGIAAYLNEQSLKSFYHRFAHVRGYVLTTQDERMLRPSASFTECAKTDGNYSKYCPEMIVVPTGKFLMGSPTTEEQRGDHEGPQHEVTITRPFAVSKFEVTFDQWDSCAQDGGCTLPGAGTDPPGWGRGKKPAVYISWEDAQQYVKWLSKLTGQLYRLLSESEWEYAARAGKSGAYSFEGDASSLGEYAWYKENSGDEPHFGGERKANGFGLHDMHGNLYEWVEDCWHDDYDGAPVDGASWITNANCVKRVMRGGSFASDPPALRSASRAWFGSYNRPSIIGFRVGRTLNP